MLRSPKLLLLAEVTSALDTETERIVQETIDIASIGRTTIVIAHHLSTILNFDIITVVQAGRVVESGSHDELMCDENGIYSPLVKLQQTPVRVKGEKDQCTSNIVLESSSSSEVSHDGSIKMLLSIVSR